jgi:cellulose synthase/poly-beta-1,6-N-acetylglucosamine synthase-like glycosyltransferase
MSTIYLIGHILSWAIFIYFASNTLYLFVIALCGRFIKPQRLTIQEEKFKIAILIPCIREDQIILDTAIQAMAHNYPSSKFTVTVIADKLRSETVAALRKIPVDVMEVNLNMKSRSLHAALEKLRNDNPEIVMILDADNIMGPNCLEKVNAAFHAGFKAVQCHRTAKNKNTAVALLDAISEEININLFRRGPSLAGLSAAPIGSGMAFSTALIREIFSTNGILENPGEDREIDMQLMRRQIKMEFLDDALVYDEKVNNAEIFEKQRVRWLEAQVNHVKRFFDTDMKATPKSFLFYNKFFQNLLLPRALTIVVFFFLVMVIAVQIFSHLPLLEPPPKIWFAMMGLYFLTLFISIPRSFYRIQTLAALTKVPLLMISMIRAVLQMKNKRTEFLHTPKSFTGQDGNRL